LIGQQYLQINNKKIKLFEPMGVAGVELGYAPPSVRHLYIFIEYNYMMLFGGFDGQLLSASIGIANKF
jgi:hypothetical protein